MSLRPPRLQPGARIGVVSPSYWIEPERLQRAVGVFGQVGYEMVLGDSTKRRENKFAGSPGDRADDIMAMFADDSIDAIVCARGGYGGNRVWPLLDYDLIRAHPKIFVGFSDATGFLASMAQRSGLVTFHGPMMTTFGRETIAYNLDTFQRVLSGADGVRVHSAPGCRARVIRPGTARGPLWGGNVSLVEERLGTAGQIDTHGAILFLEEIDERLHAFDRMLQHLRESGSLAGISGLVLGELLDMKDSEEPFGRSAEEIVMDACDGLDIPIIANFPCGHGACQATLPVSHEVELHAEQNEPYILMSESPVA
ncbi:MAG: LD-carboxypeptidase [Gammaproteobacteria bacterium]|nr:LD-carboxypeptidase [Gammaproteobacteria bacterium]MBT8057698.1 LD-carboxypeptidase [Gammaproteobacteria bacterium]